MMVGRRTTRDHANPGTSATGARACTTTLTGPTEATSTNGSPRQPGNSSSGTVPAQGERP